MMLSNVALERLGAQILFCSSNADRCPANNLLNEEEESIWKSGEGLPQQIIISLAAVQPTYDCICKIGFYCWHDYDVNPKRIQMWVATASQAQYVHWAQLELKQTSGKQYFDIHSLPSTYPYIKLIIVETFGDFQTYLNKIYLMAEQKRDIKNSRMNMQRQIHSSRMQIDDLTQQLRIKRGNLRQSIKERAGYKQGIQPHLHHKTQNKWRLQHQQHQPSEDDHNSAGYGRSALPKRSLHSQRSRSSLQGHFYEQSPGFNRELALQTALRQVVELTQTVEQLERKINVLEVRVSTSHNSIQHTLHKNIQEIVEQRIDEIIERKIDKVKSERHIKDRHLKPQEGKDHFRGYGSEYGVPIQSHVQKEVSGTKTLTNAESSKRKGKDILIIQLMNQLQLKLKERQRKIKKIEEREKRRKIKN